MQTIMYRQGSVKYQLNLTRAENENRYSTDLTDNISFQNVSACIG